MPKCSEGQKRPADVIWNAVHVMKIATGAGFTAESAFEMSDLVALIEQAKRRAMLVPDAQSA